MNFIFENIIYYFNENPIGQLVGIIALLVNIFTYISTNEKRFFVLMALTSFCWGFHFHLMGQMSGAVVNYFDIICSLLVLKSKGNIKVFSFLCVLYVVIGVLTIDGGNIFSAIPIINGVLTTYLLFYFSGVKLKIGLCVLLIAWLVYSISTHSIGSVISDFLLLISGIIGAVKIKREEILLKKKSGQLN
ncbi:hypothetical protein BLD25_02435 [Candidatus Gracilibacteria bacterium GN02-872]|nr:hypothetical protein BLD25_02435 [Candidatus Gracilibacteria bacterium GN02-872]